MGFYVPYVVNGAKHSARLFRRAYQQQSGEGSGVSRPGDLKVSALAVPGTGFRVAAGGGIAQSRDTSASSRESYGPINDAQITITDVPGTGSSGGRRDLVILEITDPEMESVTYPAPTTDEGWQDGNNFCRVTIIPGVAASVTSLDQITTGPFANVTGITLAAITWPASTGTITSAMITDLREVHSPGNWPALRAIDLNGAANGSLVGINNTDAYPVGGQTWPFEAETPGAFDVAIPTQATHMAYTLTWSQLSVITGSGSANGRMWLQIGANSDPDVWRSSPGAWDVAESAGSHTTMMRIAGMVALPANLRGKTKRFLPRVNRLTGVTAATPRLSWASKLDLDVMFTQQAV